MRRLALVPLVVVLSTGAVGWLYLVEPPVPGPRIAEALPLDELARHDAVPLVWFAVVWGTVAALLGLYARWAGLERVTAALLVGLGVCVFVHLETGVCVAIFRNARSSFQAQSERS